MREELDMQQGSPNAMNRVWGPQIRGARRKFLAMAATYSLGAFNDNFFKQAASLLAVSMGLAHLQGWATVLFTLPFILLAAPAGYLADRFPKRNMVIAAKGLELAAMCCGAVGLLSMSWTLILVMVFMMGVHSTIFSPALNGSIPELYPAGYVLKANSFLKMATTMAILLGIIMAGLALSQQGLMLGNVPTGRFIVAICAVAVACVGLLMSLFVPFRPAANPQARFPYSGPVATIRVLIDCGKDRLLAQMIYLDAFVWFIAVLQIQLITNLGRAQLGLDDLRTSYLVVSELLGVAIGGLLCGRIAGGNWFRVLIPGFLLLAGCAGAIVILPLLDLGHFFAAGMPVQTIVLCVLLMLAGLAGGLLLVPLESFIQARPPAQKKGGVIASANFTAFLGMLVSGLVFIVINEVTISSNGFAVVSLLCLVAAVYLWRALPRELQ